MLSKTYFLKQNKPIQGYEKILLDLSNFILPSLEIALETLNETKKLLINESNVLKIESPCTVVGDIHGQFDDVLEIIKMDKKFVFLGDYVDRGGKSVELLLYLCIKKLLKKETIFFIKGNHETPRQNETYGFKDECVEKYDMSFWIKSNELFEMMSICAVIDQKYFLVHGGISPDLETISQISFLDRTNYTSFENLLWSDPMEKNGYQESSRGAGYLFGPDKLDAFLEANDLQYLVRSHQLVMEGHKMMGKCIFVWSAPNYLGMAGNIASVMNITRNGHTFDLFDCCNYQNLQI